MPSSSPESTVDYCHKAAFLDRDGVINVDHGYVSRWEDFEFLPGAIQGMKMLQEAGYLLVVVTNQSGIARGYFSHSDYQHLTTSYRDYLSNRGINLSGIYHCPHHPCYTNSANIQPCSCRKPAPGLIFRAQRDLNLSLHQSILIGDRMTDIQAATAAGVGASYLIEHQSYTSESDTQSYIHFDSLLACALHIIRLSRA